MEPAVQTRATEKPEASARKDRRLRAVYSRELQNSVFFSALIVSAGMAAAAAVGLLGTPSVGLAYLALNLLHDRSHIHRFQFRVKRPDFMVDNLFS